MKNLKNQVNLIGIVKTQPQVIGYNGGKSIIAKFPLTVSNGNIQEPEQQFMIVASDQLAGLVKKLLKKGSKVAINGKLVARHEQGDGGRNYYATEILINEFLLLK